MTETTAGHIPGGPAVGVRATGAWLLLVSLVPALVCYFAFAVQLRGDIRSYQDYTAAQPCPADPPARERENCVRTLSFTVDATRNEPSRSRSSYVATLSGAPFWNGPVDFGDPGPLLRELRPGDQVTGTVWRGAVMTLAKDGVRQSTTDEPRDEAQMTAGLGTFTGLLAAIALWFGVMLLSAGPRGYGPYTWRSLGKPLLIATAVVSFGVAYAAFLLGVPWWVVPAVAVPVVAFTAWQFDRYRRQQAAGGVR
ncbi:hypothetical protein [Streptomyces sp. NPDC088762]|uniref:hypothetical protein n=1 Tax=Streptomyces sp. NPDC088762 TaxID=3365891 RepID=UPI00380AAA07